MKKGGYQILDLKDVSFALNTAQVVKGAYDIIEGTRKPIYVSGLTVDNVEVRDAYVDFAVDTADYVGLMGSYTIRITASDNITVKKNSLTTVW